MTDRNRVFTLLVVFVDSSQTFISLTRSVVDIICSSEMSFSCKLAEYINDQVELPLILFSIGALISANSNAYQMILGGRWLTGFGASMAALGAK